MVDPSFKACFIKLKQSYNRF